MREFISDTESNGLLDQATTLHCAVIIDVSTEEVTSFTDHDSKYLPMREYREVCRDPSAKLIGHNFIKHDAPLIAKLEGIELPRERVGDTMVLGRLVHPDIKKSDFERARRWKAYVAATDAGEEWTDPIPLEFPGQLIGYHSLEAWGYRMGLHKGDYAKVMKAQGLDPWAEWRPEMHDYMLSDGQVNLELYKRLMAHEPSEQSVELEHRIAWLCAKIERNGFPFDTVKAAELHGRLVDERESLRRELIGLFPNWKERLPDFIPARNNKTKGYIKGVPVERWREHEFNPQSRAHIIDRLRTKYGWKPDPEEYTQKPEIDEVTGEKVPAGQPKMDEEVLARLPYPECKPLTRMFLINKRIGQLAEGKQAWLKVQKGGKIHAQYNTNGTPHGRAAHSRPNISAVPKLSSEFGRECRELFYAPDGWVLVGADQQGIQLRCLAADLCMAGDEGHYISVVTEGDPHTANQEAAGLPTRDKAKTFIYAFLFGGQAPRIGSIAGGGVKKGKALINAFTKRTPGLERLMAAVQNAALERGWIKGIDGRKVPCRSPRIALNYRLASQEAVICKQWGCDWEQALLDDGLKHGWDGDFAFVLWAHDEFGVAVRDDPDLINLVCDTGKTTGRAAGQPYNFKCPLDVETKVGANWAETH